MTYLKCTWAAVAFSFALTACGSSDDATNPGNSPAAAGASSSVLDLNDVKTNPDGYDWFDFKPNIEKLILAGTADSKHIAILWYTTEEGGVALHYHSKTESVFVIDGTQTDAKGTYPTGTVYFNPPGSGHQVTNSTGFFVLAYAAPPDFANTDLISEYTPVRIDTTDPDLTTTYPFETRQAGVQTFSPALDSEGGLSAQFIATTAAESYAYTGNYLLVLKGSCEIDGATYAEKQLVVSKGVAPLSYAIHASKDATCLAMGISF
jgi:hypothetical protein